MRSAGHVWLVFAVCLLAIVAAVGWLSVRAVQSEQAEATARQQAALEENARLALWRIDSALAPLVTQESSRPAFSYDPFYQSDRGPPPKGKAQVAVEPIVSPLVQQLPADILLYFQVDAAGHFSSPRVPAPRLRSRLVPALLSEADVAAATKLLTKLHKSIEPAKLLAMLPAADASVTDVAPVATNGSLTLSNPNFNTNSLGNNTGGYQIGLNRRIGGANTANYDNFNGLGPANQSAASVQPAQGQPQSSSAAAPNSDPSQVALNQAPSQLSNGPPQQQPAMQSEANSPPDVQQKVRDNNEYMARAQFLAQNMMNGSLDQTADASEPRSSMMTPLWLDDQLALVRRVHLPGGDKVQGCLLDWPAIRQELLATISDLLPSASLEPAPINATGNGAPGGSSTPSSNGPSSTDAATADALQSRRSAVLPVRLEVGQPPPLALAGLSPVRMSLVVAWSSLVLGAVAVAMLLHGVMLLSERRGSFVSAVTHELRTPLTTFRMYAEMLSEGMVPEEANRRRYLETLRVEADRLTHLVENVLVYSRLESGGPGRRIAPAPIRELLGPAASRLRDRAEQAGFELKMPGDQVEADEIAPGEGVLDDVVLGDTVLADPGAVEQILFNLVDNACKYAATAQQRVIEISAAADGAWRTLTVSDHGPGIDAARRRLLFQAFRKSAHEAAVTAPGVGLGLALCRRLARDMGGDLVYQPAPGGGASFVLKLKRAASA